MQNNKTTIKTSDNALENNKNKKQNHKPKQKQGEQNKPKRKKHVYGVVDLGTNNCRLLVAIPSP